VGTRPLHLAGVADRQRRAFDVRLVRTPRRFSSMGSWAPVRGRLPVDGRVPDPSEIGDGDRRRHVEASARLHETHRRDAAANR